MSAIKGKPNYKRRTGKIIKCAFCSKDIYIRKSELKINNFCNKECHDKYQSRNKITFVCKSCGVEFYRSPSWIKQKSGLYCSIACRNKDDNWKLKSCIKANEVQQKRKGLNKLELIGNDILDSLGIKYKTQVLIANKFLVDVLIENKKTVIQWDGDYWHGKDKMYEKLDHRQKKRYNLDKSQDAYMKQMGFTVLRFWESEVYKEKEKVIENIKNAI